MAKSTSANPIIKKGVKLFTSAVALWLPIQGTYEALSKAGLAREQDLAHFLIKCCFVTATAVGASFVATMVYMLFIFLPVFWVASLFGAEDFFFDVAVWGFPIVAIAALLLILVTGMLDNTPVHVRGDTELELAVVFGACVLSFCYYRAFKEVKLAMSEIKTDSSS